MGAEDMATAIRVRFSNGVLKPLENLRLKEGEEVMVTIETLPSKPDTGLA